MKPVVVIVHVHDFFLGFRAVIPQISGVPTDLTRHTSIQSLKCFHLSLVLGTFLDLLEEEVELSGEHVHFLDGVHAPLMRLETFFIPTLVGHHLLDQSFCPVNG
jgi:hypothetical protein